jgi:hypothetical protein
LNPVRRLTQPLQKDGKTATECNEKPLEGGLRRHSLALPTQSSDTPEHQLGANMVHEISGDTDADLVQIVRDHPDLTNLIRRWPMLHPAIREHILASITPDTEIEP